MLSSPLLPGLLLVSAVRLILGGGPQVIRYNTRHGQADLDQDKVCARLVRHIYHGLILAQEPPDLAGTWTSQSCEVRPGPEYVLRKYLFSNNKSDFELKQYYYADADCGRPLYTVEARGTLSLRDASWTVPGGWNVDYQLNHVLIIPHSDRFAAALGRDLNQSCPDFTDSEPWRANIRFEVLNYKFYTDPDTLEEHVVTDKDCTTQLDLAFHELQLVRLELHSHSHGEKKMLYLGDVHTDPAQRHTHVPYSYQEPMLQLQTQGCPVCRKILKADGQPPSLHRRQRPPIYLYGEWFSTRCETRPNGMFLTRRLIFQNDNRTWEGFYYHYADPLCREPTFTIYAKGIYIKGVKSRKVAHAHEFDFHAQRAAVTPEDKGVVYNLNHNNAGIPNCGKHGSWKRGVEQDITDTNGCVSLGIKVPHTEYDLIRQETRHHRAELYIGQRPTDGASPSTPAMRPTSFQPPLARCGDVRLKPIERTIFVKKSPHADNAAAKCKKSHTIPVIFFLSVINLLSR